MRVKCLAQEHNTIIMARTRTRTSRSGVRQANLKGAMSRFVHLEKLSLNFSSLSFAIRVNLRHPSPSLFLFGLFLPLWCLSTCTLANNYLEVSFQLTPIFNDPKNNSEYRHVAPLIDHRVSQNVVTFDIIMTF